MGRGELVVEPNPVVEGEDVMVDYQGTGKLYYSVDSGEWRELPLDGDGKATIPAEGELMIFSNQADDGTEAFVEVLTAGVG